jgi:t-SNARE complex subunit (syntaxin)
MNYDRLNEAIKLLTDTANQLQVIVGDSSENTNVNYQTVETAQESVKKALAEMSAAINPPIDSHIPPEILAKAEKLGIPLDDIEIRVAISQHDISQVAAILEEIDNKAESIQHRRKYFLIRLPDMRQEKLGPRVPVVTAKDFQAPSEPMSKELLNQIKAKYNLDKLTAKKSSSRSSLFAKIKQAQNALGNGIKNDEDEEIPF